MKHHVVMLGLFLMLCTTVYAADEQVLSAIPPSQDQQSTQTPATELQSAESQSREQPGRSSPMTGQPQAKNKLANTLSQELTKKTELTGSTHDATSSLLQVTLGLFVVLMIIAAAAWFARRFGHFNVTAKGNLRIVGGLHLGSRERVVLMQVGDQQLLVGVAPGRIQTLHVLETPIDVDDTTAARNSLAGGVLKGGMFGAILKKVQQP